MYKTTEITPYASFTKQFTFDVFGRIDKETSTAVVLANGKTSAKTIKKTYKNGSPWQILDDATSQPLWQTNATNARGQLTTASMGNGNIAITNTYDTYGFATQIKHDRVGISPGIVMTLNTVFDPQKGNLNSRTNSLFNWNESFQYDSLDRLSTYTNAQGTQETQAYDDRGRITQNAVGTYNYTTTAKPYQNTSVTITPEAKTYYTAKPTQNITYNTFKSPVQIEEVGIDKVSFIYNDGNDRSTMFYGGLQVDKLQRRYRKHYSADGSMEVKEDRITGIFEFATYIGGDGYSAPIVLKSDGTTQNYIYLHRDYQGSILAITNDIGQVVEKRLFDAWGNIAKVQDGAGNTLAGLTILDRGYTGHEHLQSVGLIHMNGRLYDPKLHRFLQPDNYVQEPFNTQNYNRYGYCFNNPLKYSDPSGEFTWSDLFASVAIVVGTALAIWGGPAGVALGWKLIGSGIAHFGGTAAILLNKGGSWDNASNYIGFQSPTININTGWGDSKPKTNGVAQTEPVVTPKTVDDVKKDKGNQLDSSTVGQNFPLFGGHSTYAGGNNPMTYNKDYTYSYVPTMITDYPAIGHDRRYDNLEIRGASGLFFDTRAIGADWKFVSEQFQLFRIMPDPATKANALILGAGLGWAAVPKTIYQMTKPTGLLEIMRWYYYSSAGVTNKPGN